MHSQRGTRDFFDPDNLKFSSLHARHRGQVSFGVLEKALAARYDIAPKLSTKNLDRIPGTQGALLNGD
jgi:hypothetical protein